MNVVTMAEPFVPRIKSKVVKPTIRTAGRFNTPETTEPSAIVTLSKGESVHAGESSMPIFSKNLTK